MINKALNRFNYSSAVLQFLHSFLIGKKPVDQTRSAAPAVRAVAQKGIIDSFVQHKATSGHQTETTNKTYSLLRNSPFVKYSAPETGLL